MVCDLFEWGASDITKLSLINPSVTTVLSWGKALPQLENLLIVLYVGVIGGIISGIFSKL